MRFLYLVFAVLLLVSLATPGYGQKKVCPGRCTLKCGKHERPTLPYNCGKYICCVPVKKGK
ncbi:unnamed protein product [Natator depressus]